MTKRWHTRAHTVQGRLPSLNTRLFTWTLAEHACAQVGNLQLASPTPPGIVSFLRLFMSWTPRNQTPALLLTGTFWLAFVDPATDPDQHTAGPAPWGG